MTEVEEACRARCDPPTIWVIASGWGCFPLVRNHLPEPSGLLYGGNPDTIASPSEVPGRLYLEGGSAVGTFAVRSCAVAGALSGFRSSLRSISHELTGIGILRCADSRGFVVGFLAAALADHRTQQRYDRFKFG